MEEKERQENKEAEFSLEDILQEFGGEPATNTPLPLNEDTLVMEPITEDATAEEEVRIHQPKTTVSDDTMEVLDAVSKVMAPVKDEAAVLDDAPEATQTPVTDDTVILQTIPKTEPKTNLEETVIMKPLAATERPENTVTADTIRLDTSKFGKGEVDDAEIIDDEEPLFTPPEEKEAFTESWEPEYEQPIGEYVPPQTIIAHPRSRLRELKSKLVAGPEKRYYELAEKGLGKLQICMVACLLTVVAAVTLAIVHNSGSLGAERLRFVIFGQLFLMLTAALLGSFQLIKGVEDMFRGRFSLDSLLVITFVVCCVDAAVCLKDLRVPCCAVFCLEMFMSLWGRYHRRVTEMGTMDTMRRASRLDRLSVSPDDLDGRKVLLRGQGRVEDLMDHYYAQSGPEKAQGWYALAALVISLGIGVYGFLEYGISQAISLVAISLLASVPATAFISLTRPMAILEKRLHNLGTVICGWQGVKGVSGKVVFPLTPGDLFPTGCVKMNGVKFFGSREPDEIVAYCTALVNADGGGLAPLFNRLLDSRNGHHYDVQNLRSYDGGIGGEVCGEPVLVGTLEFLQAMGAEIPEGIRVDRAVCISVDGELCGLFAVTYEKARATAASLGTLCAYRRLRPVLEGTDFMLTASFLRARFGINPKRLQILDEEQEQLFKEKTLPEEAPGLILTTKDGIAPLAFGITGARALRTASRLGLWVHILGGLVGMATVLIFALGGGLAHLSPVNMFLYHLVWMVPGLLITNWTREI